jgi:outer membrane receptor protein involved in Fe transport
LRTYVNTSGQSLRPETATNWGLGFDYAPTNFLQGLDVQATWYQVKINGSLTSFINPNTQFFNDPALGFSIIVPTDLAKAGVDVAGCSNNNTPTTCVEFEAMVKALLNNPRSAVTPAVASSVLWINDGGIFNAGYTKLSGIDFNLSYDWDIGNVGAFNVGVAGTYYLHRWEQKVSGTEPQDQFHLDLSPVGGLAQNGVETFPRMHYRARLGWSNGPWSLTGFMNYDSHYFHAQNAPPNVNSQCTTAGGIIGGGSLPCAINNYTNIEPSYYTFDLSAGYDTGDDPANDYLKHIGIQLVVQNLMDRDPAFGYRIAAVGGNPAAFDILKSIQGRTISVILTKTW